MATQPGTPAHYCPACRTTTPAPHATAEALVQAGIDHQAECTGTADLRQRIAAAIWERRNPGHDWAEALYPWKADDEADADAVLAVVQPELDQLRAELEQAREQAADAEFRATDARAVERRNTDLLFDTLYRRWQSTVVEARRQAARADTAEAELAKTRASTGRRRAVLRAAAEENSRLRAELDRTRAELATARQQIAAVLALPAVEPEALERMDPEQYHQAIGYNDGLAASTHAINDLADVSAPTTT